MSEFRRIPSIEQLISRPALDRAASRHGRDVVTQAARDAASELRLRFADDTATAMAPDAIEAWLESRTLALAGGTRAGRRAGSSTPRASSSTPTSAGRPRRRGRRGGRADRGGYSNLEFDLGRGDRGHCHAR
jgi:hypothetical protein